MRSTRLWLIAVIMLCVCGVSDTLAQTQQPPPSPQPPPAFDREAVTHVINMKYVNPNQFLSVLEPFRGASGARISANVELKTLTISGKPEIVAAMEAIISKLDVNPLPEKNAEITTYLLVTSEQASSTSTMPAQLGPVLKQLRSTFSYKDYQLLDTIVLRNRLGMRSSTSQQIPLPGGEKRVDCNLVYTTKLAHDDKGDIVRLSDLSITIGQRGLMTDIDVRPGQMVVVGKTTDSSLGNNAVIAVFSAKIVD